MTLSCERRQQTIAKSARVSGFGLFGGVDVTVEFCPAEVGHGIVFERIDLVRAVRIPAVIEFVQPQVRCTMIAAGGATVSVIEHVMAALAGLQIDNCLVKIDAPEPPAGDGSARCFVEALLGAGIVEQPALRPVVTVSETLIHTENDRVGIAVQPPRQAEFQVGFLLDYGDCVIPRQSFSIAITPKTFLNELADARTFVLEHEVRQLRALGAARRATTQNALVFNEQGSIDNTLRFADECVRHKVLDCVGDFALLGCDISGRFTATRAGHRLNHEIIRLIRSAASTEITSLPFSAGGDPRLLPAIPALREQPVPSARKAS